MLKVSYEKEVADIKEKGNKGWCHLALTLDAATLMLMRQDCVSDNGIGDGAKVWKIYLERFQNVETPTVVTLVAQLARLQLRDSEGLDSLFISVQELLTRQQEVGEAVSETLFNAWFLNGLPSRYESSVTQENIHPAANLTELKKMLQKFHESTALRHHGQSSSVALAVKCDFKKGPRKENCFVCGILGHFTKDCRKKETAQYRECAEKGHIDRASKRQRNGSKHESMAMCPALASPDEEYRAALSQWKTTGLLWDSGCTEHIVTNMDASLDFMPNQSVIKNKNGEASVWWLEVA